MNSNRWWIIGTIMVCGSCVWMFLMLIKGWPHWLAAALAIACACVGFGIQMYHMFKIKHDHELEMKLSKEKHEAFMAGIAHLPVEEKVKAIVDYWEN